MVMRKFHNSFFTGLFIGGIVATSQYFFLLSLIYAGYSADRRYLGLSGAEDAFQSFVSLAQAVLLGSFAAGIWFERGTPGVWRRDKTK